MQGRGDRGSRARPIVYCVVPGRLAPKLHELLRRHFREDASVEVIVERRDADRRDGSDRRAAKASARKRERRLVRSASGRRVGERRVPLVTVPAPPLPRRARTFAGELLFVERLEPSTQQAEDVDTARLIRRIQAGESEEFAILYMRYFDRVYGYLKALLRNRHEADDATQAVFLKVMESLPRYDPRLGTFRGWMFVIARNHAMDQLKALGRLDALDVDEVQRREPPVVEDSELRPLDWISDRDLNLFIERLPLAQRQVLFLRYVVGLRSDEIATILGQSHDAVRQHHTRAMRFLRARLAALGREPKRTTRSGSKLLRSRMQVLRARRFALTHPGPVR